MSAWPTSRRRPCARSGAAPGCGASSGGCCGGCGGRCRLAGHPDSAPSEVSAALVELCHSLSVEAEAAAADVVEVGRAEPVGPVPLVVFGREVTGAFTL